jgi:uncharacterized phage protein (TIGR02218 family)
MKRIPLQLQTHLREPATTWCFLLRVACVGRWDGVVFGFTTLDVDLSYDDGAGLISYRAENGFKPERIQSAADFSVDNTDLMGWVAASGITVEEVAAGLLDYAEVTVYRVNYMDLIQGHEVVMFGTCGQTKCHGNAWVTEYRSLMQQARQTISTVYSLTCRAGYGDERCGMPFVWTDSVVSAGWDDPNRVFVANGLAGDSGFYDLGVIQWLSGSNAGLESEVFSFEAGGLIRLALPAGFDIEAGDTFRIRQDCDKAFATCKAKGNVLNFRGEHLTPVSDTSLSVPGAYVRSVDAA